jgi:hypothetical protein
VVHERLSDRVDLVVNIPTPGVMRLIGISKVVGRLEEMLQPQFSISGLLFV